ncbi:Hypothetical protein SRAE_1000016500 [Strongyloides ratti]|uniref:Uncharacterized protein n=1 Tax=Strongyloides ratti TaxID=34506 RepID=A0A090L330_STRRB|nr:Hypothetical protein SRAE_1000016500 [Strongyloides ratti]CEF61889.1 Hypothetical protein SRAE_1000016500 [Strongyloides ratti]
MQKREETVNNSYANVDTWKIMFDLYMYMKNRDWVEVVEEEREREILQRKNYISLQNIKQKDYNSEKNYKVPKHSYQTPNKSCNNKKRDVSGRTLRKQRNNVKSKPLNECKIYTNQRPEFSSKSAEKANNKNN